MTLEYWWAKRNNRRDIELPDLSAPYVESECNIPGTPESRLATCLKVAYRQLVLASKRADDRRRYRDGVRV